MATESEFLKWLSAQQSPRADESVRVGIGDDLAVLNWKSDDLLLVGIDQVLDGVHFDSKVHPPHAIGRKAMNRNLSDCAAMACLPAAAVVSVALPRGSSLDFAQQLYLGLRDAAEAFDCPIVGGDTSAWDAPLSLTVSILGKSAGIAPRFRSGAERENHLYVTGPLGGSLLGRHLTFEPRIKLARELAALGVITAMIDISDGLSRDLAQLCRASAVGAIIDVERIPIHPDAQKLAQSDHRSLLDHALHDGEDHELLFAARVPVNHPDCTLIGKIIQGDRIDITHNGRRVPLPSAGWEAKW